MLQFNLICFKILKANTKTSNSKHAQDKDRHQPGQFIEHQSKEKVSQQKNYSSI